MAGSTAEDRATAAISSPRVKGCVVKNGLKKGISIVAICKAKGMTKAPGRGLFENSL